MDALTYIKSIPPALRPAFAEKCGTTVGHLMNCAYGCKPFSPSLAMRMEEASFGVLRVEEICPDEPWHVVRKKPQAA